MAKYIRHWHNADSYAELKAAAVTNLKKKAAELEERAANVRRYAEEFEHSDRPPTELVQWSYDDHCDLDGVRLFEDILHHWPAIATPEYWT